MRIGGADGAGPVRVLKYDARVQGHDGKVNPIPDDEDFARPGTGGQEAADLTLAVHLQQEELFTGHYSPASRYHL